MARLVVESGWSLILSWPQISGKEGKDMHSGSKEQSVFVGSVRGISRRGFCGVVFGLTVSSCSLLRPPAPASKGQFQFERGAVSRLAVIIPPLSGRQRAYESSLETGFVESLMGKGYTVVNRSAMSAVKKEVGLRKDAMFDVSTAAEIGKMAGASHIVLLQMPQFSDKRERDYGQVVRVAITAQVIEVSTSRVVGVVSDDKAFYERQLQGGAAGAVADLARQCAAWFP